MWCSMCGVVLRQTDIELSGGAALWDAAQYWQELVKSQQLG